MKNIVVTGAANGLGRLIADAIERRDFGGDSVAVHRVDTEYGHDVRVPQGTTRAPYCYRGPIIAPMPDLPRVDALINCAGINRLAWFEDLTDEIWEETISTNAMAIWKTTNAYLPALGEASGTVLNIISNASHVPMRCSLAYNASKAAAHIMTLQMARELFERHSVTVFGISPNKLADTQMSQDIERQVCATRGWTPEQARDYQLASLPTRRETEPAALAEFIAFLLSTRERHEFLHGCILPYGA